MRELAGQGLQGGLDGPGPLAVYTDLTWKFTQKNKTSFGRYYEYTTHMWLEVIYLVSIHQVIGHELSIR